MKQFFAILFFILLGASSAHAVTIYVDNTTTGCSTPSDTDYDPATDTCGSGSETVYNTVSGALGVATNGDTVLIAAGTYTSSVTSLAPASGVTLRGEDSTKANWPVLQPSSGTGVRIFDFNGVTRSNVTLQYLKMDLSNVTTANNCVNSDSSAVVSNLIVQDFECRSSSAVGGNAVGDGIRSGGPNSSGWIVRRGLIEDFDETFQDPDNNPGSHGMYWSGTNGIIEHLTIRRYTNRCIQVYNSVGLGSSGNTFRHIRCEGQRTAAQMAPGSTIKSGGIYFATGNENTLHNSVIYNDKTPLQIRNQNQKVYHNVLVCEASVSFSGSSAFDGQGSSTNEIRNNIILGCDDNSIPSAMQSSGNVTSGTLADVFIDHANGNFNLKEASTAIDFAATIAGFSVHQCTDDPDEANASGTCDAGMYEASIRSTGSVESGDQSVAEITWLVASQGIRDGTGLQSCDFTDFALEHNAVGLTEDACSIVGTNKTNVGASANFVNTPFTALYTRPASAPLEDNQCNGDPNTQCYNGQPRTWASALTLTNNTGGGPGVTWTSIHYRCLWYFSGTTPAATDWLRAEDASNATADTRCPIRPDGLAAVAMGVQVTGANPDNTTFAWFANRNGGAYSAMTNVVSSTALAFAGNDASDPTTSLKDAADAEVGLTSPSAVCGGQVIAQQSSSPTLDCAQNDDVQVILVVRIGAAAVGDNFCIRAALSGQTETSVTATQFPCFQVVQPAAGL